MELEASPQLLGDPSQLAPPQSLALGGVPWSGEERLWRGSLAWPPSAWNGERVGRGRERGRNRDL